jgi:HSP20 family protein
MSSLEEMEPSAWCPAADVFKTCEGWIVKMDVAGVRPADLRISLSGKLLRVEGRRPDRILARECHYQCMEIPYHFFERSVEVPGDVADGHMEVRFEDGMLYIHLKGRQNGK